MQATVCHNFDKQSISFMKNMENMMMTPQTNESQTLFTHPVRHVET